MTLEYRRGMKFLWLRVHPDATFDPDQFLLQDGSPIFDKDGEDSDYNEYRYFPVARETTVEQLTEIFNHPDFDKRGKLLWAE